MNFLDLFAEDMIARTKSFIPVIEFYDLIAEDYDLFFNESHEALSLRNFVKHTFLSSVKHGPVIDFGGGTGLDLPWLCQKYFKIYFCEPSEKMRSQAKKLNDETLKSEKIIFLDTPQTDFHLWAKKNPFPEKANAILLNFSVLNCIEDTENLFLSFSKIIKPQGFIFILALDTTISGRIKYFFDKSYLIFSASKIKAASPNYKNKSHLTFRHSVKALTSSSKKYFTLNTIIPIKKNGLMLVRFQRNLNDK